MSIRIQRPFLVVVEGQDDEAVLNLLLAHLSIDSVQLISAQGKNNIRDIVAIIAGQDGFAASVIGVAIVCDADRNPAAEQQRCEETLRDLGKRNAYFLLPGNGREGMLEDLCLEALDGRAEAPCVSSFVECATASGITLANEKKFRMKAFLMLHDEDKTQKIGWAAERGIINPAHEAFAPLRQFLTNFTS